MKLQSRRKLECGRCVTPEDTLRLLTERLQARYAYRLLEEQVAEQLYWTMLWIEETGFRSMGKGINKELSLAGAMAEAAEWLLCRPLEALPGYVQAHQDDLKDPLRIEDLLPHVATATPPVMARIKNLDAARHWVRGHSLLDGKERLVPIAYAAILNGPNGKAAGNVPEEAVMHATLEIFERRAHITVLREQRVMPTFDPDGITDPVVSRQLDFLRAQGIEIVLKDLSFGGHLPCIGAYFHDPHIPPDYQFHHAFKVGAAFGRTEALQRIFTEYVQGRRRDEFIRGAPAEVAEILKYDFRALKTCGPDADNFLSAFMFGMVPYRNADFLRQGPVQPFEDRPGYADCLEDIEHAVRICRELGKDLIVVDHTDPEIGFAVVRVLVPGFSDVLPFHPPSSPGLFRTLSRSEVLAMYSQ